MPPINAGDGKTISEFPQDRNSKRVMPVAESELEPTNALKNNPSGTVTRDGNGNPTTIDIVIGSTTYRMTLTWVNNLLTAWSAWSEVE